MFSIKGRLDIRGNTKRIPVKVINVLKRNFQVSLRRISPKGSLYNPVSNSKLKQYPGLLNFARTSVGPEHGF